MTCPLWGPPSPRCLLLDTPSLSAFSWLCDIVSLHLQFGVIPMQSPKTLHSKVPVMLDLPFFCGYIGLR